MRGRGTFLATATVAALLALPAAAQAADAFVDFETGVDGPTCGAIGSPCKTIPTGIDNAGVGETVRVDDRPGTSSYASVSGFYLGFGKSLVAEEFVGGDEGSLSEPDTIIEGGDMVTFNPTVTVPAGTAGSTIQGFRIRSLGTTPVRLESAATLVGNRIDEDAGTTSGCFVQVLNSGNTSTIGPGNTLLDPTPAATPQAGVCVTSSAAPTISANTFADLNTGVQNAGGNSTISSNTFTGTRGMSFDAAIEVTSGAALKITANLIESPGDAFVGGIRLEQTGASPDVGATLRQNSVLSHRIGIAVIDTEALVLMIGNLVAKSGNTGLPINDSDNDDDAAVIATNLTIVDSLGTNVNLARADLFLNSSIIGGPAPGITTFDMTSNCTITFSRGPSMAAGGTGCTNFQTTAGPGFVDPDVDYHLAAGSPMIDMGDPNPPGDLDLDIDGDARVTDGNGDGIARRDIGADETATVFPAAPPAITPPAASVPPKKKRCKKRKKRPAAAKKKCKRKRK